MKAILIISAQPMTEPLFDKGEVTISPAAEAVFQFAPEFKELVLAWHLAGDPGEIAGDNLSFIESKSGIVNSAYNIFPGVTIAVLTDLDQGKTLVCENLVDLEKWMEFMGENMRYHRKLEETGISSPVA